MFLEPRGYTGLAGCRKKQGNTELAINAAGELNSYEHCDRRVSVLTHRGRQRITANTVDSKLLNIPNNSTINLWGTICFTNPPDELPEGAKDKKTRATAWPGVCRIAASFGVTQLCKK